MGVLNLAGLFFYSAGLICFAAPGRFAPGGAGGIATMLWSVTGFPAGCALLLMNIPLLILAFRKFPGEFAIKTVVSAVLLSVLMELDARMLPAYKGEPLAAALFAGALMGIGLGLMCIAQWNPGGMPLLGLLLSQKNFRVPADRLLLALNAAIVLGAGLVYHSMESVLYAALCAFTAGYFRDRLTEQILGSKLMIIISDHAAAIRNLIFNHQKGATILKGRGGYSGEAQDIILSVAGVSLCDRIQQEIESIDPNAFVIVSDASRARGKGIRTLI